MPSNVARGSLLGIAGQAWHLVAAFVLYAILARVLGPADFGRWRVVLSVLTWFEILLAAGLVSVVSKILAEDPSDISTVARAAYLGQGATSAVSFLALVLGADLIAGALSQPQLAPLLRVSALDIPLYGAFMVASSVLLGMQRFERQAVAWTVYATAKLVVIGGLVLLGWGVSGALVGNALASIVGFGAAWVIIRGERTRSVRVGMLTRSVLIGSMPFLALSLLKGFGDSVDLWLVSTTVKDPVGVGWYAAAVALAGVPVFLMDGLNRVVFPSVSRAHADGDQRLATRYTVQGMRLALIVTALALAVIGGTGRQVLEFIYSDAYAAAYWPLVVLMVAAMGRSIRSIGLEVLKARGRLKVALGIVLVTTIFELLMLAVLTPMFGLIGAAVATALSTFAGAAMGSGAIRELLGPTPLGTLWRTLLAAALVGMGLYWVAPGTAWLLLAYPGATMIYFALLWLFKEIDAEDVSTIRNAMSG